MQDPRPIQRFKNSCKIERQAKIGVTTDMIPKQSNVKYHPVRTSPFAIIFWFFFFFFFPWSVFLRSLRKVKLMTSRIIHVRGLPISPSRFYSETESRCRHDRGRLDGGETKKNHIRILSWKTDLLLDLGQDTSGVVSFGLLYSKTERQGRELVKHTRDPGKGCTPPRRP